LRERGRWRREIEHIRAECLPAEAEAANERYKPTQSTIQEATTSGPLLTYDQIEILNSDSKYKALLRRSRALMQSIASAQAA
ncbi:MAG: hypothetical protein AAFN74_02935, partial [Myxococcota bacterium]